MRRFIQRLPSLLARNLSHSPASFRHSSIHPRVVVPSRLVFFSSQSDSAQGSKTDDVVSKEELKKKIQRFWEEGDEDAIPDLFEAMMLRKLSGKHNESDDEIMEEVRKYPVVNNPDKLDDTDSDSESDSLRDGDLSHSDVESAGRLREDDSSDSDIDGDGDGDGQKDVDLSKLNIKMDGRKADKSSYSDSESD